MTDHATIARRYIDLWNERTPSRRREMLSENWTADARYIDPLMSGDGHEGVDALIAGVQQKFPDFSFKLIAGSRTASATMSGSPGASALTASTARSRAPTSPR
ncbi:hypothetical protein ABIF23_006357 [Bradyrhizobium elkanii]